VAAVGQINYTVVRELRKVLSSNKLSEKINLGATEHRLKTTLRTTKRILEKFKKNLEQEVTQEKRESRSGTHSIL